MFVHHAAHATRYRHTHTHTHALRERGTPSARTSAMVLGSKAIRVLAPSAPLERCHIRHLCGAAVAAPRLRHHRRLRVARPSLTPRAPHSSAPLLLRASVVKQIMSSFASRLGQLKHGWLLFFITRAQHTVLKKGRGSQRGNVQYPRRGAGQRASRSGAPGRPGRWEQRAHAAVSHH